MNFLLDTCVISELAKIEPHPKVTSWISGKPEAHLFLSSITIGEIQKGISKLPVDSAKRNQLQSWLDKDLVGRFDKRTLPFDVHAARKWGEIQGAAELAGCKMSVMDSLIASIGIAYDLTVVTRNVRDMEISRVRLFNPWE